MHLTIGTPAPNFNLPDQEGALHSLEEFRGKWVLLYFYPKDDTPGCTLEACGLRDNFEALAKYLVIIGVSGDSVESHKKFTDKYDLPFLLLADTDKLLSEKYGTNGFLFPKRTSFLIDATGVIVKIYENVNPNVHAKEIVSDITELLS